MQKSRAVVERLASGDAPVYAVNTGVGLLADVRVPPEQLEQLQRNVVRSHACGVGDPLARDEVRAMMLIRANVLAKGFSGIRPLVAQRLCDLLNCGVTPLVPSQGSVGASGDLAPLAHIALVLIGEGEAEFEGNRISGAAALLRAGIQPIVLASKEGISLVNGTQAMLAVGCLELLKAETLALAADKILRHDAGWIARHAPRVRSAAACMPRAPILARSPARPICRGSSNQARSANRTLPAVACRMPILCVARRRCMERFATLYPKPAAALRSSSILLRTIRWCSATKLFPAGTSTVNRSPCNWTPWPWRSRCWPASPNAALTGW